MYNRQPSIRYDRILQSIFQRNPQSLVFLLLSVLCVVYIVYRTIFYSPSTYALELQAAENNPREYSSLYNLNHNVHDPSLTSSSARYSEIKDNNNGPSQSLRSTSPQTEEDVPLEPGDVFSDWLPPLGTQSVPDVDTQFFSEIESIYVIPGGGSGLPLHQSGVARNSNGSLSAFDTAGYPEWTRRRTSAAYSHFSTRSKEEQGRSIFLALSAGSLNAPNVLLDDRRVMFECQHTLQHLAALGVESRHLFGDWYSWDTVTNAVALRNFLDGLLLFRGPKRPRMQVHVFISDFHHLRMRQALSWVLSLHPQPLISSTQSSLKGKYVEVVMHVVDSLGLPLAADPVAWKARMQHEEAGVRQLQRHQLQITHMRQLQAFLFLGGHGGLRKYLLQQYRPSTGAGW